MSIEIGHVLGPYEILERAGAGGMGEVFKARDTRLDRTVAIKVLPPEIAGMPNFQQRFEREAKAISSLNHPNICTLYDVGHHEGADFLVMEYLEGETLADRMLKGAIPYSEMLQIAVQIAAGLDSAHQQGMIHRDLKPGNIMLTKDGAKLLDFGLAKLQQDPGTGQSPTVLTQTTPLTGAGTILGTMQYMAPEQLEGSEADARSDIFAFGAILYEMATGKRAFEGKSNATLIAAIIEREPAPISVVVPETPPLFERLVKKCLSKDPQKRWQSASDLSDELRWMSQAGSQVGLPAHIAAKRKLKFTLARVVGAVTIATTLLFAYLYYQEMTKPAPELPVARYTINIRQGLGNVYWPRISPDGRAVAFQAEDSLGQDRIWVRPINSLEAYPLLNTESAKRFFWSPDSKHLAFFVDNQLKRIPVTGGQAQLICQGPSGADGSWGDQDLIIFDGSAGDTMKIVPAGGGIPRPATLQDTTTGEGTYGWPWFLPGGESFIFTANTPLDSGRSRWGTVLRLGHIDSTSSRVLYTFPSIDRVEYSRDGYILYVSENNLMGLPFDADRLEVTGEPKPIAMRIGAADNTYAFGVSNDGTLLYHSNNRSSQSELVWVDRKGVITGKIGQLGRYRDVALSPDGNRLAYSIYERTSNETDIWVYDLKRNVPTRLTFDPRTESKPMWSPDGQYVYFTGAYESALLDLYRRLADGTGEVELVLKRDSSYTLPSDFTPDGTRLLYYDFLTNWNIGILNLADSDSVAWFTNEPRNEVMPRVSPNGEYVAYVSNETNRREVYVRKLDGSGGKWQISTEEADNPRWSRDGTELFYLTRDDRFMAVPVRISSNFEAGNPKELFKLRVRYEGNQTHAYDVAPDGQRFVVNSQAFDDDPGEIVVVQNWAQEFKGD